MEVNVLSKIRELRINNNLLQKELANKLNINRSTVAKWETGRAVPRTEKLKNLARILNCSVVDLLPENE